MPQGAQDPAKIMRDRLHYRIMQILGQPSSTGALCTSLDIASSKWYSDSCMVAKPYICKVSSRPTAPAPSRQPTTKPAITTRRILTTTADRAYHPCQQRVALVFDASSSLTAADFQVSNSGILLWSIEDQRIPSHATNVVMSITRKG